MMSSSSVRKLPPFRRLQGVAPEEERWIFLFVSDGGLSIGISFSYDDTLLMLFCLEEARKSRGWALPRDYQAKILRLPRQPLIRGTRMEGFSLDAEDKYANVRFEADGELVGIRIPKDQVVRLLAIAAGILRSRGWGTHNERCFFYQGAVRCRFPRAMSGSFCERHNVEYANLSDRDLFEQAARYLRRSSRIRRADREGQPSREFDHLDQANARSVFATLVSELIGRGYTHGDVVQAVGAMAQENGIIEPLAKNSRDPKWKQFEKLAFGIALLKADGAEVTFDETITGLKTGRPRQVDICVRYDRNGEIYFAMVECRDKKVSIDQVEALHTKKKDVGADHVVVVSSAGFQKGAHAAAKAYHIDIFKLKELAVDWTEEIRTHVNKLPWPRSIEFDMPQVPVVNGAAPILAQLTETPFVNDADGTSTNLGFIVRDVCIWAHESRFRLPCEVHIKFDPGMSFRPPQTSVFVPVYGVKMVLSRYKVETQQRLEFPPHTVEYRYTNEMTGKAESFVPAEVDKALHRRRKDLS